MRCCARAWTRSASSHLHNIVLAYAVVADGPDVERMTRRELIEHIVSAARRAA